MLVVGTGGWWATAALVYPLYEFVFGQDNYDVAPGGTVNVPMYLQETVGPGDTAVFSPGGVGLITAGVQVVATDPPQPSEPARIGSLLDIEENPAFDFPTPSLTYDGAKLSLAALAGPAVTGEEQSPNVYRLLLGTFRFTAGSVLGESTPLRVTDYDPGFDDVVTGDLRVLDSSPIYDGVARITTVPEPGTLVLLAAAVLSVLLAVFWQRRGMELRATRRLRLEGLEGRRMLSLGDLLHTFDNPGTNPAAGSNLGRALAVDGQYTVVGVPNAVIPGGDNVGRAYVLSTATGAVVSTLANPRPDRFDNFGAAVAISGNIVVVGAPNDDTSAAEAGIACVFDAATGNLLSTLLNPTPTGTSNMNEENFGCSVAISGNMAIVGKKHPVG